MEIIRSADVVSLSNSGVTSEQLLCPKNSRSHRVTITRVTVAPGARNPRHAHAQSEQAWVALHGSARLLLDGSTTEPFHEGDVVPSKAMSMVSRIPAQRNSCTLPSLPRPSIFVPPMPRTGANPRATMRADPQLNRAPPTSIPIVVPLSAFPQKQAFPPLVLTTGLLVHMFLVGVPIALCVRGGMSRIRT